jgi:hypothetical protein
MKIREIHIAEGLLSNMVSGAARAVGGAPAALQQWGANRRSDAAIKVASDAAWKQWTNRVAQIQRSQGVKSAAEIPQDQYQDYLQDFVESAFLRGDLSRYDTNTQTRIAAEIDKITQARGNAAQVRSLFQGLGTQAVAARQPRRGQAPSVDTRGMDPETAKMAQAMAAAQQAIGGTAGTAGAATPTAGQDAGQAAGQAASQAQPAAAAKPAGGWVDAGQGLYLKPATSTTPPMASYRKNIFSLSDTGQWLDTRDRPVTQTWQAFLNQSLGAIEQMVAPAAGQAPAQQPQTAPAAQPQTAPAAQPQTAPAAQPAAPQPKPITVTDERGTVWSYKDSDRKWYSPEGEPVDDPEDIKKLNQRAKVQFQNRAMATQELSKNSE